MLKVLVGNTKGGCGKTTIATNLAAAFSCEGYRTAIADADRQRSALAWLKHRPKAEPRVTGLDWTKTIEAASRLERDGIERLVVDAPAGLRRKAVEELICLADAIVVPVLPSPYDQAATARFLKRIDALKPIRKHRVAVALVANRVRPRTRAATDLEQFFAARGAPAVAVLRDSAAYTETAGHGLGIFDVPGRRTAQVRADWVPLLTLLDAMAPAQAEA